LANSGSFYISRDVFSWQAFYARIDEVRIYNRALEQSEIIALYKSGLAKINASQNNQLTDGLVGLWSFNGPDISGTDAFDRSGQGNHGVLNGNVAPTIGKVSQALSFDGNDYVQANDANSLDIAGPLTVSLWMNPSNSMSGNHNNVFIAKGNEGNYMMTFSETGAAFRPRLYVKGLSDVEVSSSTAVSTNQWSHVVGVYDNSKLMVYVNGLLTGSDASTGTPTTNAYTLDIGSISGNWGFTGTIDEVRIYNRALSAEEILRLYNLGH